MKNNQKIQNFITKANTAHGDGTYDYSSVFFKLTKEKIKIICPVHGAFEQRVSHHLAGRGCRKCFYDKISIEKSLGVDQFIIDCNEIHNNKYDYSQVNYINAHTKVSIICPEEGHGTFKQTPHNHRILKHGCVHCKHKNHSRLLMSNTEEWIEKATGIHDGFYTYEFSDYTGMRDNINITCPIHREFSIVAGNHIYYAAGCTQCGILRSRCYGTYEMDEKYLAEDRYFYHVRITNKKTGNIFDKVGISKKGAKFRFSHLATEGFSYVILSENKTTLKNCLELENKILDELDDNGMRFKVRDLKETRTKGWTECFYIDDYNPSPHISAI